MALVPQLCCHGNKCKRPTEGSGISHLKLRKETWYKRLYFPLPKQNHWEAHYMGSYSTPISPKFWWLTVIFRLQIICQSRCSDLLPKQKFFMWLSWNIGSFKFYFLWYTVLWVLTKAWSDVSTAIVTTQNSSITPKFPHAAPLETSPPPALSSWEPLIWSLVSIILPFSIIHMQLLSLSKMDLRVIGVINRIKSLFLFLAKSTMGYAPQFVQLLVEGNLGGF